MSNELSKFQFDELRSNLKKIIPYRCMLNDFERGFIRDTIKRFSQFNFNMQASEKQLRLIDDILDKLDL